VIACSGEPLVFRFIMFILSFLIVLLFLNKSYYFLGKIEDSNRGPTSRFIPFFLQEFTGLFHFNWCIIRTFRLRMFTFLWRFGRPFQALQKVRTEMMKKQLEDAQRLEVDTRLMNAASKHCIKIERWHLTNMASQSYHYEPH
jgi:hypothetical protein